MKPQCLELGRILRQRKKTRDKNAFFNFASFGKCASRITSTNQPIISMCDVINNAVKRIVRPKIREHLSHAAQADENFIIQGGADCA
jgi:hypothetical protein